MFPFPIAKPQKCDIQTFYGAKVGVTSLRNTKSWIKPVGVSHVYMMAIGGGGNGDGATQGGGSGAVTVWYGAAKHVPDSLLVVPALPNGDSTIYYRNGIGNNLNVLLIGLGASGSTGGSASSDTPFSTSGFFKSTAGQIGSGGSVSASTTTFLSAGALDANEVIANYGYKNSSNASIGGSGYFLMQPIIVGVGGSQAFDGGIGCGGGSNSTGAAGNGGAGMILIASW